MLFHILQACKETEGLLSFHRDNEVALKRAFGVVAVKLHLSALSANAAGQLDVLGHDGNPLGVDGAQVGVLEETDQVGFASLLQSHHSGALEPQVSLEVLGDFSDQTLEREFADQQLSRLLVASDLSQSHGAGPVTMGLLHATGGWRTLTGCLCGELLPRGFATGRFTSGLLGSGHVA